MGVEWVCVRGVDHSFQKMPLGEKISRESAKNGRLDEAQGRSSNMK